MSAQNPKTRIKFSTVPFAPDYKNIVDFSSAAAQVAAFDALGYREVTSFNYIKKDMPFKVDGNFHEFEKYNYVRYQNRDYKNPQGNSKWYYAFITKVEYVAENVTLIYHKTDVWQTWQFNTTFYESYIERSHVAKSDDVIGANTAPEPVSVENYIFSKKDLSDDEFFKPGIAILLKNSPIPEDNNYSSLRINDRVVIGGYLYLLPLFAYDYNMLEVFMSYYLYGAYPQTEADEPIRPIENIVSLNLIPQGAIGKSSFLAGNLYPFKPASAFTENQTYQTHTIKIDRPTDTFGNGYTPRNKKLFNAPFNYIKYFDYAGTAKDYKYELFNNDSEFLCIAAPSVDGEVIIKPNDYKSGDMINSVVLKTYPPVTFCADTWTQYKQNMAVMGLLSTAISGATSIAGQFAAANPVGAAQSALSAGMNLSGEAQTLTYNKLNSGAIVGNSKSPVMNAYNYHIPAFYNVYPQYEDCQRIDDFFDVYGYAIEEWGKPNFKNRSSWNYIKLSNCNIKIEGGTDDAEKIRSIFNSGVTVWHGFSNFGDYSQTNN